MRYFWTTAPLSIMEEAERINWTGWGFNVAEVSRAVALGYQQQDGNELVSILPIADEELLREKLGARADSEDELGCYRIVEEAQATAERDRLKAINMAAEELRRNTPTDEDIFRAQQLKLLTQINIKLGGTQNV